MRSGDRLFLRKGVQTYHLEERVYLTGEASANLADHYPCRVLLAGRS